MNLAKNYQQIESKKQLLLAFFLSCISLLNAQETIRIDASNSPFYILSDTTIIEGDSLLIGFGGELVIGNDVDIHIYGGISIQGSLNQPAKLLPLNEGTGWGQLIIHDSVDSFNIAHAEILDGRVYATNCIISYTNVTFTNNQTLVWNDAFSRFFNGQLTINNCTFNGTNQGEGLLCHNIINPVITNCRFDSIPDAVEYLNCDFGRIGKCTFQNCKDDAIDLNHCRETVIDSNFFDNIFNRGMEIGSESNGSSTDIFVNRNILVNCTEAITFKEGSTGRIVNNTFFNNEVAVSALVLGTPENGSSVEVINSIFQNNNEDLFSDSKSNISTSYSSSNNQLLLGEGNILGPAKFISPYESNFQLNLASDCINSGSPASPFDPDGSRADIGALFQPLQGVLKNITFWPNPANDFLNIHLIATYDQLQILDYSGRICAEMNIMDTTLIEYPTTNLSPGIYFVVFTRQETTEIIRFVVQ